MVESQSIILKERLKDASVFNPRDDKQFIPYRQLEKICDEEAVAEELARSYHKNDPSLYQELASSICHGQAHGTCINPKPCIKIFAILVLLNKPKLIEQFLKYPLCDDDLPFCSTRDFTELWSQKKGPMNPLEFHGTKYDVIIEQFISKQWSVLAPSFDAPTVGSMRCNVYEFDAKVILPIIEVSDQKYVGGFGSVEKVKIHGDHHHFKHEFFALKTIHLMRPEDRERFFKQELDAFQKAPPGSHLIEIYAAFKKGGNYSFLFPWADGGTLNHLWTQKPYDIFASRNVQWSQFSRWICAQCHGIIRDLRAIHEPRHKSQMKEKGDAEDLFGIHSDIKPDNILYFSRDGPPLGSLKVSDLGLMKFHKIDSRTKTSHSMGVANQTYRAPEHDMGRVRSRKIDIWAFGCLFAEFLTWAIFGQDGIEAFKTMRINEDKQFPDEIKGDWSEDNFFIVKSSSTQRRTPERKSSVEKWFTDLINDLGPGMGNTFIPQFLRFIQNRMLHPDRKARAECKTVERFLHDCLGNPDNSYWDFKGRH